MGEPAYEPQEALAEDHRADEVEPYEGRVYVLTYMHLLI